MLDTNAVDLSRKYRPQTLDDVCGQTTVVNTIKKWVKDNALPQIVALFGSSGTGKTTCARIIADKLGAVPPWDYKEFNVADDSGIDVVRGLIEALHNPSIRGRDCNRVFFLDEIQSMSKAAQNALLKPLEEIRPHQYVIFSTTNAEKLIEPLKNRAIVLQLKPLPPKEMAPLLERVLQAENRQLDDNVRKLLLESAGGSSRQMLTILQRLLTASKPDNQMAVLAEMSGVYDDGANVNQSVKDLASQLTYSDHLNPPALITSLTAALEEMRPESIRMVILGYLRGAISKTKKSQKI